MNRKLTCTLAALFVLAGLTGVANAFKHHEKAEAADKPTVEEGFAVLFDGSSTEHFRSYKEETFPEKGWVIDGDTLHIQAKSKAKDIITKAQYGDFDLRWEWKAAKGANSGVMYRVSEEHKAAYFTGPEYQILDDAKHRDGKNAKTSSAALYALIACNDKKTLKPVGEWNNSRIVVQDNNVEHYLNGEIVVAYVWGGDEINTLIANSKFKKWGRFMKEEKGHIAFQNHNDDVWFRNIRIKDLSN